MERKYTYSKKQAHDKSKWWEWRKKIPRFVSIITKILGVV